MTPAYDRELFHHVLVGVSINHTLKRQGSADKFIWRRNRLARTARRSGLPAHGYHCGRLIASEAVA